jgi:HPt (histidine-containing phosphotransfer) domain-containing protein
LSRGNEEFVRKYATLFVESAPTALEQIVTSYANKDYHTVRETVHRMKPTIDTMRIITIADEIQSIERLAEEDPTSPELPRSIEKVEEVINQVIALLKNDTSLGTDQVNF